MGCDKFECRKADFCEDSYYCDKTICDCYRDCSHCVYEDDDVECPVARNCERMLRD